MNTAQSSASSRLFSLVGVLALVFGVVLTGYGVLVLSISPLGGVWLAISGGCFLLAGLFSTDWAGEQFDLSVAARWKLVVVFALLGTVGVASFIAVGFASFTETEIGGSSAS